MGGPQPAQTQVNRKDARRHGRAMRPEQFAQGERVTPFKPGNDPVVEKHIVQHTKPRRFSSAFLQPDQFLAELGINHGAGLGFQGDAKPSKESQQKPKAREKAEESKPQEKTEGLGSEKKDLELFYESANAVPTLELSFEGKPAPAPAHLRTKAAPSPSPSPSSSPSPIMLTNSGIVCEAASTGSVKNSEETSDSCAPVASLQKSLSQGSGRFLSPSLHKMREKLVRSLSGRKEKESEGQESAISESNGGKQTGRLRRILGSMKLGKKKTQEEEEVNPELFGEDCCSPRSESSVSTTYSEVSSKSQSYKCVHRKRSSRARRDEEDDAGIFRAVRQGAMFHGLEEPETKSAISKLVAKHRRNSTWDNSSDHIFSPRQPRLPSRDAQVLLAPPKRLHGEPDAPARKTKSYAPPRVGSESLGSSGRRALQNHGGLELPSPPVSPGERVSLRHPSFRGFPGFVAPLPLPETQSAGLSASSPGLSTSTSPGAHSVGGGAVQITASTSPTLHGASAASPTGAGLQSSFLAGVDTRRLEQFSLEDEPSSRVSAQESIRSRSDSASHVTSENQKPNDSSRPQESLSFEKTPSVVAAQGLPIRSRSDSSRNEVSMSPEKQKSSVPRSLLSFEQIVAGRGRSPPTDNTLMKFFFKCREIEHLNRFLVLQKRRFLDSSEKCFHMILSRSGAGLSSMVATICTAWLLENTMASATSAKWHPIPVMNMSQKDIWQHRDAAWLFHVCGIDANAVLFLDEITPTNETVISGRVKRAVIGQDILVTKDEVASSCTIVSEKFRQEAPKLLQARYMMTLLLAGILVDTQNLSSGCSRDKQQATMLLVGAGSLGRNGFYNQLMNVRDVDYVTSFIKEIYGDSNGLTGEKPAQWALSIEQPKPMIQSSTTFENDKMPASLPAASKSLTEVTISPTKSTKTRGPRSSKISLAFRLLRNRSSVQ